MNRLDSIDDYRVFEALARTGSLSAAAREIDLSLTSVSKRLKRIEDTLGLRLVHRTTRRLALTPEGDLFAERARAVLAAASDAEEVGAGGTIRGVVRVTATAGFSQRQIVPKLPQFLAAHPGVEVQILSTDKLVDLVGEKIDVAFRQGPLGDGQMITRTIARDGLLLVASPTYLARAGAPAHPRDLSAHPALTVGDPPPRRWVLHSDREREEVLIRSAISGPDGEVAHAAALAGGGITMKASWDVIEDIRAGRLLRVLPGWWGPSREIRIIFPMRAPQPRRVRALVDFMELELGTTLKLNRDLGVFPPDADNNTEI